MVTNPEQRRGCDVPLKHLQSLKAGSLLHSNRVKHALSVGMGGDNAKRVFCRHIDPFLCFLSGFPRKHKRRQCGPPQTAASLRSPVPTLPPLRLEP